MFTSKSIPHDANRMTLWPVALMSVAMTAAIYQWRPGWAPMMRSVSYASSVVALIWLWMPVWQRWVACHWSRIP